MYDYKAKVVRVMDGDTVHLDIDLGFYLQLHNRSVRIAGINAPEMGTEEGIAAKAYAMALLPVGADVTLYSHTVDKYGRVLGSILFNTNMSFAQHMIDAGHAVQYMATLPPN